MLTQDSQSAMLAPSQHCRERMLIRPDVFFSGIYLGIHVGFGADLFVANQRMLFSTLWFALAIAVMPVLLRPTKLARSTRHPGRTCYTESVMSLKQRWQRHVPALVAMAFLAAAKPILVVIFGYLRGMDAYTMRHEISAILPGSVSLALETFGAVAYPLLLVVSLRAVKTRDGRLCLSVTSITVLTVLFFAGGAAVTGSRSFLAYYFFVPALLLYLLRIISGKMIGVAAVAVFLALGATSYYRLKYSSELGHIDWYEREGIVDLQAPLGSSVKLAAFQARDIVLRSSEVFLWVPDVLNFQFGKSLASGLLKSIDETFVDPHVLIHHRIFAVALDRDTGFPPTLVSQLWLDFGWFGVVLGALVYSLFLWVCYLLFLARPGREGPFLLYLSCLYFLSLSVYGVFEWFRFALIAMVTALLPLIRIKQLRLRAGRCRVG